MSRNNNLRIVKVLSVILLVFVVAFAWTNHVDAVSLKNTVRYTIPNGYGGKYKIRKFNTTTGMGFCYQISKVGAPDGASLSYVKTLTKGPVLYVLDKGGSTSSNKEYTYTQFALWKVVGSINARPSSSKLSSSSSYLKVAKERATEARKHTDYTVKPSISAKAGTPTLKKISGSYYYVANVKVSLKNASSYSVSKSNAPSGTKIINASTDKPDTTMKKGQNFYVRIPKSKLTATKTVKITVKATGTYKYVKIYSPANDKQDVAVLISSKKTVKDSVKITFKPMTIKVYKVDTDNDKTYLAGAKYQIFKNSSCTTTVSGFTTPKSTNSSGVVEFVGLEPGTYYVKEVAQPAGYQAPTSNCKKVSTGGAVTFKNKKNNITVYKTNKSTGVKLDGAQIGLYTNSTCTTRAKKAVSPGGEFPFAVTKNGKVVFEGMASSGTYYVKEIKPPTGYYTLSANERCIKVSLNGSATFKNDEIASGEISVQKVDSYTHYGIDGVKIGLYSDSSCSTKVKEATTSDGTARFTVDFVAGTTPSYYVKEIETPAGYMPENGTIQCHPVGNDGTKYTAVTIYNKPYGNIKLLKRDVKTQKAISGVTFRLLDEQKKAAVDINGKAVANVTTNSSGIAEFKDIYYGTYYVQEVKTNKAYKSNTTPVKFVLNANTDSDVIGKSGNGKYLLGDTNSDGVIDESDMIAYQNIISNPDLLLGLAPSVQYSLDINGDGNTTVADIREDLKILEYYLEFSQSEDENVLNAARNYKNYANAVCTAAGKNSCDVRYLDVIAGMRTTNTATAASYSAAREAAQAAADAEYQQLLADYQTALAEYNQNCPNGPEDDDDLDDLDDTDDMDDDDSPVGDGDDDYDCYDEPEEPDQVTPQNVCPQYSDSYLVDVNGDCAVNSTDVTAFNTALNGGSVVVSQAYILGDINGDNSVTDDDLALLDEFLEGTKTPTDVQRAAADVKRDNVLNDDDWDLLSFYLLDEPIESDIGKQMNLSSSGSVDTAGLEEVGDLSGNGRLDSTDIAILSDYIDYASSSNSTAIFNAIDTFLQNKDSLCEALGGGECNINDEYLALALTKVGTSGNLPSSLVGVSLLITNEKIDMKISKEDITNSKEVSGAKIVIKDESGKEFLSFTSGSTAKQFYIPAGKYTLTETVAPKGYKELKTTVTFQVKQDGSVTLLSASSNLYKLTKSSDSDMDHLIIYNQPYQENSVIIPDTGSNVKLITIVGGLLLVGGGGYFVYRRYAHK